MKVSRRSLSLALAPATWQVIAEDIVWDMFAGLDARHAAHDAKPLLTVRWPSGYQHENARPFSVAFTMGFGEHPDIAIVPDPGLAQPYEGIVLFDVEWHGGRARCAIDYFDFTHVNEVCARQVAHYFKLQYRRIGYPQFSNVVPGGYVTSRVFLYRHARRLRQLRLGRPFSSDVFARFGMRFNADQRTRAVALLEADGRLKFRGGARQTPYTRYLREMAASAVCVDLPGQGPFCYRLVEALAMGCCVVAPRHSARMPAGLRPGSEYVECAPDLSDLVALCRQYVEDDEARQRIEAAASQYFDEHLTPRALAESYVHVITAADPPNPGRDGQV